MKGTTPPNKPLAEQEPQLTLFVYLTKGSGPPSRMGITIRQDMWIFNIYIYTYIDIYINSEISNLPWSGSLLNLPSMLNFFHEFLESSFSGGALLGRPIAWEDLKGYCTDGHLPRLGTARFDGMDLDVTWWSIICVGLGTVIRAVDSSKTHPNRSSKAIG